MTNTASPLLSIVILNYNGKQFLFKCLTSIFKQDFCNFQIVFVDNASTDGTVKWLKKIVWKKNYSSSSQSSQSQSSQSSSSSSLTNMYVVISKTNKR